MERGGRRPVTGGKTWVMMLSHCPVTGGAPTRMSGAAFARLCAERRGTRRRKLNSVAVVTGSKACEKCEGRPENWPPELEIIDIKTEDMMGKKNGQRCVICDAGAELKNTRGRMVCPTCQKIISYVDNYPERVADAAKGMGKEAALAALLGVEPGAGDPADHAIAEAVRECFGRELTVEQLGLRCREEAEKAGRVAEELNLVRTLLARRDETIREIAGLMNYELVEPGLTEQLREIARRIRDELGIGGREITADEEIRGLVQEKLAADAALELRKGEAERLQEALREANGRIAKLQDEGYEVWGALDGDVEECTLVELAEMRMKEIEALRAERQTAAVPPNGPMDEALLRWAITQYQQGKLQVNIEVREVAA